MIITETRPEPQWIKSIGHLQVKDSSIRVMVSPDLLKFYKKLVDDHFNFLTHFPAHGGHITISNPNIHQYFDEDKAGKLVELYEDKDIEFRYNPDIIVGGKSRDFRNFYMKVDSMEIESILHYLKLKAPPRGLHLTVANTKGGIRPNFGKMIEIKQFT